MEIKREKSKTTTAWGTWEELLLASAVKRHGSKDWDSVALEVQARTILPATAFACKQKYLDLRRRFTAGNADPDAIPWLDDLRSLRVAELRQEVQRYDVSIRSLQSKLKRLEEEREQSAEPNGNGLESPDLENSQKNLSENDKDQPGKPGRDSAGRSVTGDGNDQENRSVNESNSSGAKCENPDETGDDDVEPTPTGSRKPDPALSDSAAVTEDSYNGSSEPNKRGKGNDSAELRDSVGQSKESSDVQSSASLTRKMMSGWRKEVSGGSSGEEMVEDSRGIEQIVVKSRALVGLLETIRAHKHSSLFERRLQSQENDKYKKMVRQHVDLETIEKRVDQGLYTSCSLRFYRDLMLLFNNAIVFFPKSSIESVSALQLRDTVSNQMHNQAQSSDPPPASLSPPQLKPQLERSDSLLARDKSSAPIIVCRKRSSISAKPSSTANFGGLKAEAKIEEKKPATDTKPPMEEQSSAKEKPVTGTRTMRRGVKSQAPANKKHNGSPVTAEKVGTLRTETKKAEVLASEKKKSAADFLKRIKRSSPAESPKNGTTPGRGEPKKKNQNTGKAENKKKEKGKQAKDESSPTKRSVGRPPKKVVDAAPAKRGRGEAVVKEASGSKRPKKRARR